MIDGHCTLCQMFRDFKTDHQSCTNHSVSLLLAVRVVVLTEHATQATHAASAHSTEATHPEHTRTKRASPAGSLSVTASNSLGRAHAGGRLANRLTATRITDQGIALKTRTQ